MKRTEAWRGPRWRGPPRAGGRRLSPAASEVRRRRFSGCMGLLRAGGVLPSRRGSRFMGSIRGNSKAAPGPDAIRASIARGPDAGRRIAATTTRVRMAGVLWEKCVAVAAAVLSPCSVRAFSRLARPFGRSGLLHPGCTAGAPRGPAFAQAGAGCAMGVFRHRDSRVRDGNGAEEGGCDLDDRLS